MHAVYMQQIRLETITEVLNLRNFVQESGATMQVLGPALKQTAGMLVHDWDQIVGSGKKSMPETMPTQPAGSQIHNEPQSSGPLWQ